MIEEDNYRCRMSKSSDYEALYSLIEECFGTYPILFKEALDNLDDKYMVTEYIKSDGLPEIVAMTGIIPPGESAYNGYEIVYSCTTSSHRHKGLIINMLRKLESSLPNDGKPLYCEGWKLGYKDKPNIDSVMKCMGMDVVLERVFSWSSFYHRDCSYCTQRKNFSNGGCCCFDDLYMKKR